MPTKLHKEYLKNVRQRYKKAPKKIKTFILSEFCVNTGYSRKHGLAPRSVEIRGLSGEFFIG